MIHIHNFIEAYQHYLKQFIPFRLLQDQATVLVGLCENPGPSINTPLEITQADIEWLLQQPEAAQDYNESLGGYMYVCRTAEDLLQIKGCDFKWAESHDGEWPNVTDLPMTWDGCEYLDEPNGEPQWAMFLLCWNNAGGPIYYVPKLLWIQARVTEHIKATNQSF